MITTGRFAPSTTGPAHPGTLLAALLAWLDARSAGGRILLRLEDLDPERCQPRFADSLVRDLEWLELDWDAIALQSEAADAHAAALDRLEANGLLYACSCSRADLQKLGRRTPDGGWRYSGRCRGRGLPRGGWRECAEPLRAQLQSGPVELRDLSGDSLGQDPVEAFGDPVVRRRDGAIAYHLAAVVDDAAAGVTRVVRGRDLAAATATQVRLQQLLGLSQPEYRHHLLLLEARGEKLAKLHGSVDLGVLRPHYDARELCGWLAFASGLRAAAEPASPDELLSDFNWERVSTDDRLVTWDGERLRLPA